MWGSLKKADIHLIWQLENIAIITLQEILMAGDLWIKYDRIFLQFELHPQAVSVSLAELRLPE